MLKRWLQDAEDYSSVALRRVFFIAAVALSLFITTAFLCAAAFVFVYTRYGPVEACLAGAAIFFIVTLIGFVSYLAAKKRPRRAKLPAKESAAKPSALPSIDPMMLAAGMQLARAVGFKKLLPILAIGGLAVGYLMSWPGGDPEPADDGD